jgi:predicted Rossmann fold nucleotide-binding protein DprA/Smf involved in DNA uptake
MVQPTPDTQALLLLLSRLGQSRAEPAPLTAKDYDRLALWLQHQGLRPGDLLRAEGRTRLRQGAVRFVEEARLEALLDRGGALGLALEGWLTKGLWVIGRGDPDYPRRLKQKLRREAPPLLFGAGARSGLDAGGVAIVGSRAADVAAIQFTQRLAQRCARAGLVTISGGAKGVDREAMAAALAAGGHVIGVLPGDLERAALEKSFRKALEDERMTLLSPYDPGARFTVWSAMDRNKDVYALSDFGVVVSSDFDKGGTWAGALENLQARWVPLFVRAEPGTLEGNPRLVERGGIPLNSQDVEGASDWCTWLRRKSMMVGETPSFPPEQSDLPI